MGAAWSNSARGGALNVDENAILQNDLLDRASAISAQQTAALFEKMSRTQRQHVAFDTIRSRSELWSPPENSDIQASRTQQRILEAMIEVGISGILESMT